MYGDGGGRIRSPFRLPVIKVVGTGATKAEAAQNFIDQSQYIKYKEEENFLTGKTDCIYSVRCVFVPNEVEPSIELKNIKEGA